MQESHTSRGGPSTSMWGRSHSLDLCNENSHKILRRPVPSNPHENLEFVLKLQLPIWVHTPSNDNSGSAVAYEDTWDFKFPFSIK